MRMLSGRGAEAVGTENIADPFRLPDLPKPAATEPRVALPEPPMGKDEEDPVRALAPAGPAREGGGRASISK